MDDVLWRREEVLVGGRRENWIRYVVVGSLSVLEVRLVEMAGAESVYAKLWNEYVMMAKNQKLNLLSKSPDCH
jgi:hypothetical protein